MKIYKYILFLLLVMVAARGHGQVMMQFNPAMDGLSVNRLANVSINNRYQQDLGCRLTITIRETRLGNVLKINTPLFRLSKGFNFINADVFNRSNFAFANNSAGYALLQTRNFMDGDYEYCFEVNLYPDKGLTIPTDYYENCFNQTIERSTPLMLTNPYDREASCNTRPNFLWQPSMPYQPSVLYTLQLVEIKQKQSKAEAIAYNQPIILQNNIRGNMLSYPALAPSLEEGKNYAWQVLAGNGKMITVRSEIWEYKISCSPEETKTQGDGYRELKENRDEGSYQANRWLRFVFYNAYGPMPVNYSVSDLTQKEKELKKLPELQMQGGFNKYELDLNEIKGLVFQHQYLLTVSMANGKKLYMSFIYKGEENAQ